MGEPQTLVGKNYTANALLGNPHSAVQNTHAHTHTHFYLIKIILQISLSHFLSPTPTKSIPQSQNNGKYIPPQDVKIIVIFLVYQ